MRKVAVAMDDDPSNGFRIWLANCSCAWCLGLPSGLVMKSYSCAVFIDDEGSICGKQHKMQLAEGYHPSWWFNRLGAHSRAFDTPFGRCGILICSDRWNADLARIPVLDGARLLLIPAMGSLSKSNDEAVLARGRENGFRS